MRSAVDVHRRPDGIGVLALHESQSWAGVAAIAVVSVVLGVTLADRGLLLAAAPIALAAACLAAYVVVRVPTSGGVGLIAVLAVFPVLRIGLGSLPIYVADVLIVLVLLGLWRTGGLRLDAYSRLIVLYVVLWLPAFASQVMRLGVVLEPTYGLLRDLVAVMGFFVGVAIVRSGRTRATLVALIVGVVATSLLATAQEYGPTADAVRRLLTWAAPAFSPTSYSVYPERAFALFTAPTTLAGFLAVIVPIVIGCAEYRGGRGRLLALAALPPLTLALLATYSRQWLPTLAAGILVLGALRPGSVGRTLLATGAMIAVAWIALSSGTLDAAYFDRRFSTLGPQDVNVQTRVQRQAAFVQLALEKPLDVAAGRGFATQDLVGRNVIAGDTATGQEAGGNDNVFMIEVLNKGALAGLAYAVLMLTAVGRGVSASRRAAATQPLLAGLTAALAAALVAHFLDNYFANAIFMKNVLWILVGAVVAFAGQTTDPVRPEGSGPG